jgi:hypothetical protein
MRCNISHRVSMFVRTPAQRLCEGPDHDDDAVEDAFEAPSVVALLNTKAKDGGGAYRCVALRVP